MFFNAIIQMIQIRRVKRSTMCRKNFTFYMLFFLAVLSSKSQQNSMNNEEKNDNLTVQYEPDAEFMTNYDNEMKTLQYDLYEKSTNNTQYDDSMHYESHTIIMNDINNDRKNDTDVTQYEFGMQSIQHYVDDKQILIEPRTNLTNGNHKSNFTSQEIYKNLMSIEEDNDFTSYKYFQKCFNITCIWVCCPPDDRLIYNKCFSERNKYFLNVYNYKNKSFGHKVHSADQLVIYDPCQDENRLLRDDSRKNSIFFNGSLYSSYYKFIKLNSHCLAIVDENKFEGIICLWILIDDINDHNNSWYKYNIDLKSLSCNIVSTLLLMSIFLVYSLLPELRNVHGFMLRNYCGALSVAYTLSNASILIKMDYNLACILLVSCLSILWVSYLWLIMMSIDMWWTFRKFSLLKRNITQRKEKKKLVFYMIVAWGLPIIPAIIIISIIIDMSPYANIFCIISVLLMFLFHFGIKSICIINGICFSISTALKIARYEKETSNRLTDSESGIYNNNKKWFNLYLKLYVLLFIIMGINWSIYIINIFTLFDTSGNITFYFSLTDIMENLCFFIIFVRKNNIKQILLKLFGCGLFSKHCCAANVTLSNIPMRTITSGEMQKKMSPCKQRDKKDLFDETKF